MCAQAAQEGLGKSESLPAQRTGKVRQVGLVGRIARWKGQHVFLEAAYLVRQRFADVAFQIVGAPLFAERDYERELQELTAKLNLSDCVEFTGFRPDVTALIAEMEIVVHASITGEPFGQVVIEGMAMAKPIVATAGGGILEIVVDGVTGLLVPMGDAKAMAAAICQLLQDPASAAQMGSMGQQRVREHFTIEKTAAKVEQFYDNILKMPRGRRNGNIIAYQR